MKTKKPMIMVMAGIIGCALCAVPFLLPMMAGVLGMSILGLSLSNILCGALILLLAIILVAIYLKKRNSLGTSVTPD